MTIFSMLSSAHRSRSGAFAGIVGLWLGGLAGHAIAAEKAAFLLPGSINDQSWNAQGYQGAEKLKAIGWDVAYTENVPAADMVEALRDYARKDYNVVIGHTGRFLSAAQRVGPDFPILFRVSQWKATSYGARIAETPEELEALLVPISEAGVDLFDCSQRRFWEPTLDGSSLNLAGWAKKLTGKPSMSVGSVTRQAGRVAA